jgi:hypothetical protein
MKRLLLLFLALSATLGGCVVVHERDYYHDGDRGYYGDRYHEHG